MVEKVVFAVGVSGRGERIPALEVAIMGHDPAKKSAKKKLEELMERVRSMPPGGDLASLLTKEIDELAAVAEKEALAEREKAEQNRRKAGFSPSGKSS